MIDRQFRHDVAENVAAYLRGEITTADYIEHTVVLRGRHQESLDSAAKSLCAVAVLKATCHPISVDQTTWDSLVRHLAFLESSLPDIAQYEVPFRPVRLWVRLLAGLMPVAAVVAYGWRMRGIDGITLGLGWLSLAPLAFLQRLKVRDDANMPVASFYPFSNESEWLSNRHLADRFSLPSYDPSIHHRPVPSGLTLGQQLFHVAITALGAVLVVALLGVFWPVLLVRSRTGVKGDVHLDPAGG